MNVVSPAFFFQLHVHYVYVEKAAETTFVQKTRTYKVYEIDGMGQNIARDKQSKRMKKKDSENF